MIYDRLLQNFTLKVFSRIFCRLHIVGCKFPAFLFWGSCKTSIGYFANCCGDPSFVEEVELPFFFPTEIMSHFGMES